jgi:hypothetical protein
VSDYLPRPRLVAEVPRIDEASRRRPGDEFLADGNWITLLDGQAWCFPRPIVRWGYVAEEHGFGPRFGWGPEYDRLIAQYRAVGDGDDNRGIIGAQLDIAAFLLTINYELTRDEIGGLVQFDYRDGASDPIREPILFTALGMEAPKPGSDG